MANRGQRGGKQRPPSSAFALIMRAHKCVVFPLILREQRCRFARARPLVSAIASDRSHAISDAQADRRRKRRV